MARAAPYGPCREEEGLLNKDIKALADRYQVKIRNLLAHTVSGSLSGDGRTVVLDYQAGELFATSAEQF
jgi:hypothetical protein